MGRQNSRLVNRLKEALFSSGVLHPNVSPNEALPILSEILDELKLKPSSKGVVRTQLKIFLSYVIYVVTKIPEAVVSGICEDILCRALEYSSDLEEEDVSPHCFDGVVSWLEKALSNISNCPNPYIRLELFRLAKLFVQTRFKNMKCVCFTFIQTICDIKPNHIYPCGNGNDIQFTVRDLFDSISAFSFANDLQTIISADLFEQLKYKNEVACKNDGAKFISQCIQLIGVYAVMAGSDPNPGKKCNEIMLGCSVFRNGIGSLVSCVQLLPQMSPWQQFQHLIALPPFRHYVIETVQALTAAIDTYNDKRKVGAARSTKGFLMSMRDVITEDLAICHKKFNLPRLLLSRQIQGPNPVHTQALLIMKLTPELLPVAENENGVSDRDAWRSNENLGSDSDNLDNENDNFSDELDIESNNSDNDSSSENSSDSDNESSDSS